MPESFQVTLRDKPSKPPLRAKVTYKGFEIIQIDFALTMMQNTLVFER